MKTAKDPRHLKRIKAIEELFSWQFSSANSPRVDLARRVIEEVNDLDKIIQQTASEWPINQINKIDLAILRLAIFELTSERDIPYKVVVDEAVELAKRYGGDSSPGFINGVLGKVINEYGLDKS